MNYGGRLYSSVMNLCLRQLTPYAVPVIRTAGLRSLLVLVTCWLSVAVAHENQEFHLADTRFCVDPASIQIVLDLPSLERTASAQKALKRDLSKMLEATLSRTQVSYRVLDRCTGARDYTLLVADVRYLDPKTYIGFGTQAYNYNLFLQVGSYDDTASVQPTQLLTDRYNAFSSEIYAEGSQNRPFEQFVVGEGSKLVQELAAYWWEDNPRRSFWITLLPPLLGTVLALLIGVSVWGALRRRDASKRNAYSSSGPAPAFQIMVPNLSRRSPASWLPTVWRSYGSKISKSGKRNPAARSPSPVRPIGRTVATKRSVSAVVTGSGAGVPTYGAKTGAATTRLPATPVRKARTIRA